MSPRLLAAESVRRRWPRLGLAQRVTTGVSLGVAITLALLLVLALATLQQMSDATGQEQVMVTQTVALSVEAAGQLAAAAGGEAIILPLTPPGMAVQVVTDSGRVLASKGNISAEMTADHAALLGPLMASRQAGYHWHYPGPGESFVPHVVAYAPVPGQPGWGVFVQQDQPAILNAPDVLIRSFAMAGVAALALAVAAAWFDVRRVTRPLRTLARAAEAFATGDLTEPVVVNRTDELGSLAASFETMRQRLGQSLSEIERWNHELEERVEARTRDVERRNRQLAAINTVAALLSESLDEATILNQTLDRIIGVTGFDVALYRQVGPDHCMHTDAQRNRNEAPIVDCVDASRCLCGRAAQLGVCQSATSFERNLGATGCSRVGMRSGIAIPLSSSERVEGVLFLASKQEHQFESGELDTLAAIGSQVGMALTNARLYQRLREREQERVQLLQRVIDGQEEERRRLAQELHDDTSQALAWLQLGLERLATEDHASATASSLALQLQEVAREALESVHRLAVELRPSILDDLGLVTAIERYVQESAQTRGLTVDFTAVGTDHLRLSTAAEGAIYRIVQAALTNVIQHAQAQHASVLIEPRDGKLILVVEDDGRGFDLAAVRKGPLEARLGLAGMEERTALIDALMTIETKPGSGTGVFLEVPLHSNTRRDES